MGPTHLARHPCEGRGPVDGEHRYSPRHSCEGSLRRDDNGGDAGMTNFFLVILAFSFSLLCKKFAPQRVDPVDGVPRYGRVDPVKDYVFYYGI